jgi:hypothetical protein
VLRLARSYGDERLEAACRRAIAIGSTSYKSVESILKHGLDQKPLNDSAAAELAIRHTNIRGAQYYH